MAPCNPGPCYRGLAGCLKDSGLLAVLCRSGNYVHLSCLRLPFCKLESVKKQDTVPLCVVGHDKREKFCTVTHEEGQMVTICADLFDYRMCNIMRSMQ